MKRELNFGGCLKGSEDRHQTYNNEVDGFDSMPYHCDIIYSKALAYSTYLFICSFSQGLSGIENKIEKNQEEESPTNSLWEF
jgi:hypothetical protein